MKIDKVTLGKLTLWAEKSPMEVDDLKEMFEAKYNEIKVLKPDMAEDALIKRARFQTYRAVKSAGRSTAKPTIGLFVGYNQAYDITQSNRKYAQEIYARNPSKAVEDGLTDADGTVLDNRAKMPWGADNPDYGKELKPNFLRTSVAIGRPMDEGDMKLLVMTHNNDQAFTLPPLGVPVKFAANIRSDEESRRLYNSSVTTKFVETEIPEFGTVDASGVCAILADAPEEFKSGLAGLMDWHQAHAGDQRRIVIVEGDVMYVANQPNKVGSYMMVIEDESTMDIEGEGVTVFVHEEIAHQLNFGAGSRVFIPARTSIGAFYDRETRTSNPEIQVIILNALGVWAIPEFRIPRDEAFTLEAGEEVQA